jgi:multicomponent Na+:H+ antiporter subunit E
MAYLIFIFLFVLACIGKLSVAGIIKALLFGSLSYFISYSMLKGLKFKNRINLRLNIRLIKYLVWLIKEIVLSTKEMIKIVLNREVKISPRINVSKVRRGEVASNVMYVNSITLTPGTVTVELEANKIRVYAITKGHYESIKNNTMYKRILDRKC